MTVADALAGAERLGLDTAPVIYYVEANATYFATCQAVVAAVDQGRPRAFTSVLTLAEVLVHPTRNGDALLARTY